LKQLIAEVTGGEDESYYGNKEEEKCYADRKCQRMSLMLRVRGLISRICRRLGLNLNAFYVLRQGLENFQQICHGKYAKVETGIEEKKGSFKLPDSFAAAPAGQ